MCWYGRPHPLSWKPFFSRYPTFTWFSFCITDFLFSSFLPNFKPQVEMLKSFVLSPSHLIRSPECNPNHFKLKSLRFWLLYLNSLLTTSTWMSRRHRKVNMAQKELLSPLNSKAPPPSPPLLFSVFACWTTRVPVSQA